MPKQKNVWITNGLAISCKHKQQLYRDYLQNKCSFETYKIYKNILTSLLRVAKRDYFTNFISTNKQNMKAIWSTINQLAGKSF